MLTDISMQRRAPCQTAIGRPCQRPPQQWRAWKILCRIQLRHAGTRSLRDSVDAMTGVRAFRLRRSGEASHTKKNLANGRNVFHLASPDRSGTTILFKTPSGPSGNAHSRSIATRLQNTTGAAHRLSSIDFPLIWHRRNPLARMSRISTYVACFIVW